MEPNFYGEEEIENEDDEIEKIITSNDDIKEMKKFLKENKIEEVIKIYEVYQKKKKYEKFENELKLLLKISNIYFNNYKFIEFDKVFDDFSIFFKNIDIIYDFKLNFEFGFLFYFLLKI
jgi:hypothetical protein